MSMLHKAVRRVEETEALDGFADPVAKAAQRAVRPRVIRNLLSGTNLGHPAHPALTDITIGAWGMSALLDAFGRPELEPASDLLVEIGLVSAVPTALSGVNDWSDTLGAERRVGYVHAMANTTALSLYLASFVMRTRGDRRAGRALGWAGAGVLAVGGYLGGHLSYVKGINVNHTAWQHGPDEWTPLLDDAELDDDTPRRVDAGGVPILLYRDGGRLYALAADCSHMGGPLDEGAFENGCVVCPWHSSTFKLAEGDIVRGPASTPQPHYETRVRDGRIEIRVPKRDASADGRGARRAEHAERPRRTPRRKPARTSASA